ncbi:Mediator of RNA polymerase II transcription subunit 31 [Cichlidogyrus casuarinus]|uniref:Mediator of RNA polymerase II transcription subunit 31 n=1 Tax=Cichlidogyrus casuarinus TaxID=1844966 RepID=A0ABD2Q539_9PLAT
MSSKGRSSGSLVAPKVNLDDSKLRFQTELEFVQCLANPAYLNFLSQQGCFDKPEFINYLKYLQYWKDPPYSKFLFYPYCLHMLDLLQSPEFRHEVAKQPVRRYIDQQMILHWQHYMRKRVKLTEKHVAQLEQSTSHNTTTS